MEKPWWTKNGATLAALVLILGVALFLRVYFVYPVAFPGVLYHGGSDSFYWERTLNYSFLTGHQLVQDCALNYPICVTNPRPPMFQWFSLLLGWVLSPAFGGDAWASIQWAFLMSTALWGALTVLPLYGLVKEAFSRRAGLLAGFLLAISPAHLQRSVASNADHDAFTLFFVVAAYYFFFRALRTMNERKWVESWGKLGTIPAGVAAFFRENRDTVLYALLSAMCLATIALSWQGWAYAPIILLVYVVVQLFVHRLRSRDPMGLLLVFILAVGPAILLAAPWYLELNQVRVWFDVPVYLFAAVLALGVLLTVTRDYPWSIVLPAVVGVSVVGLVAAAVLNPAFASAVVSGAGYFVSTKLYETIAEAQAPGLSQVILSFGWPLYFLSWAGILWLLYQLVTGRRLQTQYLFFVVWAFAAIFMAQAAARFIFNASPAFAAAAAAMFVVLLDWFQFSSLRRQVAGLTAAGRVAAFRKSLRTRHVLGAFLVVLLLLPSAFYGVDASIPFEEKHGYDLQIYNLTPDFLRPANYESLVGSQGSFYLGAFGYAFPQPQEAYPAAWRWLASQDAALALDRRPAYLSWWDYGFEAVDVGQHPTVADNFQDGYHHAGNFLAAQNESESIALLSLRLLDGDFYRNGRARGFSDGVSEALRRAGLDDTEVLRAYVSPGSLIPVVQGDPQRFGSYDTSMQSQNALYIYLTNVLTSRFSLEQLVQLYAALRSATGWDIRYFAVDTRLFPQDAQNTGIFYAPMKLSDRRVVDVIDGRVIPPDFFRIYVTADGTRKQIQDVLPTEQIVGQPSIEYQPMFYDSMFYRAYIGYSPRDVGSFANGIPGFPLPNQPGSGELAQMEPMQAWNLTHWRVVYKTAYYNPFDDVQNHSADWGAVSYYDARRFQEEIDAGTREGRVDLSPRSLIQAGVVILKYYDGAWVNGTVTIDGVVPVPGVRVTVLDDLDIPHGSVVADASGRFSVLVPFGEVRLVASVGNLELPELTGANVLNVTTLTITDEQAMRAPTDADGNGVPDWILAKDIVLQGRRASGIVFLDTDGDGVRDPLEPVVPGADLTVASRDLGTSATARTSSSGGYVIDHLRPGVHGSRLTWGGRDLVLPNLIVPGTDVAFDLAVPVTALSGRASTASGAPAAGATVAFRDEVNGTTTTVTAAADGGFSFVLALAGNYTVTASLGDLEAGPTRVEAVGRTVFVNLTLLPAGRIALDAWLDGNPRPYATFAFLRVATGFTVRTATADAQGSLSLSLPEGEYSVTGRAYRVVSGRTELWAFLGTASVARGTTTVLTATFLPGVEVRGVAYSSTPSNVSSDTPVIFTSDAGRYFVRTGPVDGAYVAHLPAGPYRVQAARIDLAFLGLVTFTSPTARFDVPLVAATEYTGTIFRDLDRDGRPDAGEGITEAEVVLTDPQGRVLTEFTDAAGVFRAPLPADGPYAMEVTRSGFLAASFPPTDLADLRQRDAIAIVPMNVTVAGTGRFGGSPPGATLTVRFQAAGAGAVDASVDLAADGTYTVDVAPGSYAIVVDEDVVPGNNATRWQLASAETLDVAVGASPLARDLVVVQRHRIQGSVTRGGQPQQASVSLTGPDERSLTATGGTFVTYLRPGTYNVSITASAAGATYGFLGATAIGGPGTVSYEVVRSSLVTGRLLVDGAPLSEAMPIHFARSQGGAVSTSSQSTGAYAIPLPPGDYGITIDHRSTAVLGGAVRYVRYTTSRGVTVNASGEPVPADLDLLRTLDNVTVSGVVRDGGAGVAAALAFAARSSGAMNGTAASDLFGSYSLALQPGTYNAYVIRAAGDRVFLGTVTFEPRTDTTLNVALGPGFHVSGVTTYRGGTRVSANVTFSGVATVTTVSSGAGIYDVLLPAGSYSVVASTTATENGLSVRYSATATVNVTGVPAPVNLELSKEVRRAVTLTWDAAQKRTISGGGSLTYTIVVRNDGNVADAYSLVGSPSSWVSFPQPTVQLGFGTANVATASVDIRPPADALVVHAPITITATSRDEPSVHGSVSVDVGIARVRGLGLNATTPRYDGRFLNWTVVVANRGNDAERVDVVLANADDLAALGWSGGFAQGTQQTTSLTNVSVAANSTVSLTLSFRATGAATGAQAILVASAVDLRSLEARTVATLSLPAITVEGPIVPAGPLVSLEAGVPYQLLAVLVSAAAVVAVTAFLTLRRRRR